MAGGYPDDERPAMARSIKIEDIAERLGIMDRMRRAAAEWVGPCPVCGGDDRFALNPHKNVWSCRIEKVGGDGISLWQHVRGVDFPTALTDLCGGRTIDPVERERIKLAAEKREAEQKREAERYRAESIKRAKRIWAEARASDRSPVVTYLAGRGIPAAMLAVMPASIRYHADLPYMVPVEGRREWRCVYRGAAMVAAIQGPDRQLIGVHRTWIDLDRPGKKQTIIDPDTGLAAVDSKGKPLAVKKMEGSHKGGAIRLSHVSDPNFTSLVCGEGIETTWSAMAADAVPDAAYWACGSLDNMSGPMERIDGSRWSGRPDLSREAGFVCPPWVKRLIYIQDGDSHPASTRAKLECGLRRSAVAVPGLQIRIVHPGAGIDLNDLLQGKGAVDSDAD